MEKIPLYSRLEVLASFLAKGKVLAITGETREKGKRLERGCLLLVTHGVGSVAPGDPKRAQKEIIFQAPSSSSCSRTIPWLRNLFFPSNIPQLDGAGSFISEKD